MSKTAWRNVCAAARKCYQKPSDFVRQAIDERVARILPPDIAPTPPAEEPEVRRERTA